MSAPTYPGYAPQGYLPPPPPPTPPTPQYPVAPSYPSAPGQLPQQYAQPVYAPQYPQAQGYPQPQMAPPAPPLVQGSIEDFYNQPSTGGGKSLTFTNPGDRFVFVVSRPLGQGDIQQQTDTRGVPQFFKDGRAKFVMRVPGQMQPHPLYPDGVCSWYVKGAARDELVRAMAEVGAPAGPPEAGAIIDVTFTTTRQSGPGMNPAKLFAVRYQRPNGAAPVAPPAVAQAPAQPAYDPAMAQAVGVVQQAFPAATEVPPAPQQYAPPAAPQYVPPAQAAMPSPPLPPPPGMSPEQEALLAQLTAAKQG